MNFYLTVSTDCARITEPPGTPYGVSNYSCDRYIPATSAISHGYSNCYSRRCTPPVWCMPVENDYSTSNILFPVIRLLLTELLTQILTWTIFIRWNKLLYFLKPVTFFFMLWNYLLPRTFTRFIWFNFLSRSNSIWRHIARAIATFKDYTWNESAIGRSLKLQGRSYLKIVTKSLEEYHVCLVRSLILSIQWRFYGSRWYHVSVGDTLWSILVVLLTPVVGMANTTAVYLNNVRLEGALRAQSLRISERRHRLPSRTFHRRRHRLHNNVNPQKNF